MNKSNFHNVSSMYNTNKYERNGMLTYVMQGQYNEDISRLGTSGCDMFVEEKNMALTYGSKTLKDIQSNQT